MAESTSIDPLARNGHTEHHSPRPRKPTRIDFLKPQLSDESLKPVDTASGVSRSACPAAALAEHTLTPLQREKHSHPRRCPSLRPGHVLCAPPDPR